MNEKDIRVYTQVRGTNGGEEENTDDDDPGCARDTFGQHGNRRGGQPGMKHGVSGSTATAPSVTGGNKRRGRFVHNRKKGPARTTRREILPTLALKQSPGVRRVPNIRDKAI